MTEFCPVNKYVPLCQKVCQKAFQFSWIENFCTHLYTPQLTEKSMNYGKPAAISSITKLLRHKDAASFWKCRQAPERRHCNAFNYCSLLRRSSDMRRNNRFNKWSSPSRPQQWLKLFDIGRANGVFAITEHKVLIRFPFHHDTELPATSHLKGNFLITKANTASAPWRCAVTINHHEYNRMHEPYECFMPYRCNFLTRKATKLVKHF